MDPKNRFTHPDFENIESNRGSRVLILRIRYSSSTEAPTTEGDGPRTGRGAPENGILNFSAVLAIDAVVAVVAVVAVGREKPEPTEEGGGVGSAEKEGNSWPSYFTSLFLNA